MALRQRNRLDTHFLVKYSVDQKFQVRSRVHIACDDEPAKEPRKEKTKTAKKVKPLAKVITSISPPQPTADTQDTENREFNTEGLDPRDDVNPPSLENSPNVEDANQVVEEDATHTNNQTTEDTSSNIGNVDKPSNNEHQERLQDTPLTSIFRVSRPLPSSTAQINAIDATQRTMLSELTKLRKTAEAAARDRQEMKDELRAIRGLLERQVAATATTERRPLQQLGRMTDAVENDGVFDYDSIPEEYRIGEEALMEMNRKSLSVGNFGVQLTIRLFPELVGPTNLKHMYNWKGGGTLKKFALCPVRREVIKKYVVKFYPDCADETRFFRDVTPAINEFLRRKEKKTKETNIPEQSPAANQENVPPQSPGHQPSICSSNREWGDTVDYHEQ